MGDFVGKCAAKSRAFAIPIMWRLPTYSWRLPTYYVVFAIQNINFCIVCHTLQKPLAILKKNRLYVTLATIQIMNNVFYCIIFLVKNIFVWRNIF